jgi:hypothetical protein
MSRQIPNRQRVLDLIAHECERIDSRELGEDVFMPEPVGEYPPRPCLKLADVNADLPNGREPNRNGVRA